MSVDMGPGKWWVVQNNIALALIPKNGTTSFRNVLNHSAKNVHINDIDKYSKRVMFVNNPLNRLVSAGNFFKHLLTLNPNYKGIPLDSVASYESWVDYALQHLDNPHWMPQTKITENKQNLVHRFDNKNIRKYWPKYFPGQLPGWLNSFSRYWESSSYRLKDIEKIYIDDFNLFENTPVI